MLTLAHQNWQILLGCIVVIAATMLTLRARTRASQLEEAERTRLRERRGKAIEDLLTAVVATIAASMSATQLVHYAQDVVGLHGPWRLLPFGGLDVAAIVCALRARRRARRGESAGISGALVWILAVLSAAFSAGEAANPWAALGRGIWALIAATLWEIGLAEERHLGAPRPDRRLGWVRWLHPAERIQVLAELATDEQISADEATRRVRQRRAARKLHRLRLADEARTPARGKDRRRTEKAYRAAERAAQRAAARSRLADPAVLEDVLPQLEMLVNVARLATGTWRPSPTPAIPDASATPAAPATTSKPPTTDRPTNPASSQQSPATTAESATADRPQAGHAYRGTFLEAASPTTTTTTSAPSATPWDETTVGRLTNGMTRPQQPTAEAAEHRTTLPSVHQRLPAIDALIPTEDHHAQEAGSNTEPKDERVAQAVKLLQEDPEMSGSEIARRLGFAERTGRRVKNEAEAYLATLDQGGHTGTKTPQLNGHR
jgi:hypothetical protein